jgi:anti-sigma-K factor RskA
MYPAVPGRKARLNDRLMREVTEQDQLMREFLLNKLELEERERIEEQFMIDRAFREQVLIAEESLIEDYLDNSLDDSDRKRFDTVFSSSTELREKLAIARAIRSAAKTDTSGRRVVTILRVAAAVIAIVAIVWLIQRYLPGQESAAERQRRQAMQNELTELNSGARLAIGEVVVLAPVNTRSSGAATMSRKGVVDLWLIPATLDHSDFKAVIKKDGAQRQFEVGNLRLAEKPQGKGVLLRIPAHSFETGTYLIQLSAPTSNGDSVLAGEYRFQLVDQP